MAQKRKDDQAAMQNMLDIFLNTQQDEHVVHAVEQRLEIHLIGTEAYIPSYTRGVMDKHFGAPVMAMITRTDALTKTVFIQPAPDPEARNAKRLRSADSMGPAFVAFGVPLRKLKLKFDISRRVILPLNTLEAPEHGTIYCASFVDIEMDSRNIDQAALEAAKQEKAAKAQAKKDARKAGKKAPTAPPATSPKTA